MEDLEKNKLGTIYCSAGAGLADSDWPVGRNRVRTATSISVKGQYMGLPFSKIPALGILAALLLSCASTNLSPIHESSSSFSREEDEKKLWGEAESLEKDLAKSGLLYNDPDLDVYLNSVLRKLLPVDLSPELLPRIKVIKTPLLNAFAMPNGSIYLHTGILARMETEDQLATVIGHELTHFTHRHSLKSMLSATNKQN